MNILFYVQASLLNKTKYYERNLFQYEMYEDSPITDEKIPINMIVFTLKAYLSRYIRVKVKNHIVISNRRYVFEKNILKRHFEQFSFSELKTSHSFSVWPLYFTTFDYISQYLGDPKKNFEDQLFHSILLKFYQLQDKRYCKGYQCLDSIRNNEWGENHILFNSIKFQSNTLKTLCVKILLFFCLISKLKILWFEFENTFEFAVKLI